MSFSADSRLNCDLHRKCPQGFATNVDCFCNICVDSSFSQNHLNENNPQTMIHIHFSSVHLTENRFLDLNHNASTCPNVAQMVLRHTHTAHNIHTSDTASFVLEAFSLAQHNRGCGHSNGNILSRNSVITSQLWENANGETALSKQQRPVHVTQLFTRS